MEPSLKDAQELLLWGSETVRTHRPLWLAHELEIDFQHFQAVPRTGDTQTSEFLALNPRHKVPVMVHGNFVLTESAAILSYLTEAFPVSDQFFIAVDSESRTRLLEWCYFIMTELDAGSLTVMRRHGDLTDLYGEAPAAFEAAKSYFSYQLTCMSERFLDVGDYLMGARISIADILLVTCLDRALVHDISLSKDLMAYRKRMIQRPAYQESFKQNFPRQFLTLDS